MPINISVSDDAADWLRKRIAAGSYATASDYVQDLIRRDQAQAAERQEQDARVEALLLEGLASDSQPLDTDFRDRLAARSAAIIARHGGHV